MQCPVMFQYHELALSQVETSRWLATDLPWHLQDDIRSYSPLARVVITMQFIDEPCTHKPFNILSSFPFEPQPLS